MKYFNKLNIYLFSFFIAFSFSQRAYAGLFGDSDEFIALNKQNELIKRGNLPPVLKALMDWAGAAIPPTDKEIENLKELIRSNPSDIHITDRDVLVYRKTALYLASEIGDPDIIRELIEQGAGETINVRTSFKANRLGPLHIASSSGNTEAVKILLSVDGVDIEARNRWGQTALALAVQKQYPAIVDLLLKKGADINTRDNDKWTLIFYAFDPPPKKRNIKIIVSLITNGANMDLWGYRNDSMRDPFWQHWQKEIDFLRKIQLENPDNQELSLRIEEKIKDLTPTPNFIDKCLDAIIGKKAS